MTEPDIATKINLVDDPPDPLGCDGIPGYIAALRALKAWAGNPSLQSLARQASIPRSTIADALDPARRNLPRLAVVTALITACGVNGDSVRRWQRVWREIQQLETVQSGRPSTSDNAVPIGGRNFLPGDIADFTGRTTETAAVLTALRSSPDAVVTISAIDGMAGIGKTTLAVHAAHLLAGDHVDGQFFIDLYGHTPGREPLEPTVALQRLLVQLGMDPHQLPREVEERAALWRAATAGRRVLVVLDNAATVEQVRPLLPGGTCPVLITSRRRLIGLASVHTLSMQVMPLDDAVALFERVAGHDRIAGEPQAVLEAVALCGYLPLAIRIAAARLRHRPAWSVADLADRLRDQQRRLVELSSSDPAIMAAFTVSLQQLDDPAREMFQLLGLHPGPDIDVAAAASLAGCPLAHAEQLLEELLDAHLLEQHTMGRYAFHDLLRAYAATQATTRVADRARTQAVRRMVEHYLHSAHDAGLLSYATHPTWPYLELPDPPALVSPVAFTTRQHALSWYAAEHAVLTGVIAYAADMGLETLAWQLTGVVAGYLLQAGLWREWLHVNDISLAASERSGDKRGQAHAHHWFGQLYRSEGDHPPAHEHLTQALRLFEALNLPTLAGQTLLDIALTYGEQAAYPEAVKYSHAGLDLFQDLDDPIGTGRALNSIGWYLSLQDQHAEALRFCEQALALSRQFPSPHVEASSLGAVGLIHYRMGNYREALRYFDDCLQARRAKGDYFLQADAMTKLGDAHFALGEVAAARQLWQEALVILEGLQHRDVAGVRARLAI